MRWPELLLFGAGAFQVVTCLLVVAPGPSFPPLTVWAVRALTAATPAAAAVTAGAKPAAVTAGTTAVCVVGVLTVAAWLRQPGRPAYGPASGLDRVCLAVAVAAAAGWLIVPSPAWIPMAVAVDVVATGPVVSRALRGTEPALPHGGAAIAGAIAVLLTVTHPVPADVAAVWVWPAWQTTRSLLVRAATAWPITRSTRLGAARVTARSVGRHPLHLSLFAGTAIACVAQIPLGLFGPQAPLDNVAHVAFPATAGVLAYAVLLRGAVLSPRHYFTVLVLFGMSTEFAWEIAEWQLDAWFGTKWQIDNADTMHDLTLGVLGAFIGAAAEVLWAPRQAVPASSISQNDREVVRDAFQQGPEPNRGAGDRPGTSGAAASGRPRRPVRA